MTSSTHQIRFIEGQACPLFVIVAVETKEDIFKVSVVDPQC